MNLLNLEVQMNNLETLLAHMARVRPDQRIACFATTAQAFDACQAGSLEDGDIIVVEAEEVIGVAWTWPIAATAEAGGLHTASDHPKRYVQFVTLYRESEEKLKRLSSAADAAGAMAVVMNWTPAKWWGT